MLSYLAQRTLVAIPTLLGVATVVFLLIRLLPGDPAVVIAGVLASPDDVQHIRHQLELDQPVWLQYLGFLGRLLHGDLGVSTHTGQPVLNEVATRIPFTAELALVSIVIAILLGGTAG